MKNYSNNFDVIVVGAGPAGHAAALTLARALRKVLVIDSNRPRNIACREIHNFLPNEGVAPAELKKRSEETLRSYPNVALIQDEVLELNLGLEKSFEIKTHSDHFSAKKVLLATGVKDLLPDIPIVRELWGTKIVHCPYCYAYENQTQNAGVLFNGGADPTFLTLLSGWYSNLKVFENLNERVALEAREICDILFYRPPFTAKYGFLDKLNLKLTEQNTFDVTENHRTYVEGIYAAGDCADPKRQQVAIAMASGVSAGYLINLDLITTSNVLK